MTALARISAVPSEPFENAVREVNEWRGKCLHHFALVELAVSECLEYMSRVPRRGEKVRRRHLIGQRFEDLANALSSGGGFEAESGKILDALNEFRKFVPLRAMLCHGVTDVLLDRSGHWTAIFRYASFKASTIDREEHVLRCSDAEERQKDLIRQAQRLCSLLNRLQDSFSQSR